MRTFVLMLLFLLIMCVGFQGVVAQEKDPEFVRAVDWMYEHGLTKYTSVETYNPDAWLTREQAAKFYVAFNANYHGDNGTLTTVGSERDCVFNDTSNADATLKEYISDACLYGLFNGTQGSFWPKQTLTKAEAITVLIRSLEGSKVESVSPRWKNYHLRARGMGITRESDVWGLDRPVTRYEMALLLYRASSTINDLPDDESDMLDIYQILSELGI